MKSEHLHQKIVQSEISAEHLKRAYDMALFERDPNKNINHNDRMALKALHDLIGLVAEFEFDMEDKIEDLNNDS